MNLTIKEAAEYSNIGIKKLLKRIAFECYINEKIEINTTKRY